MKWLATRRLVPFFASLAGAAAQPYQIESLLTARSIRPDGGVFFRCLRPSLEGTTMVFRATSTRTNFRDSVWSLDLRTRRFVKLAGVETLAPNGAGTFTEFEGAAPLLYNGTVLFAGQDSAPRLFRTGLYAVPAAGGPIRFLAGYNGPDAFTALGAPGSISLGNTGAVFEAERDGQTSLYRIATDGTGLAAIADNRRPIRSQGGAALTFFLGPALGDGLLAFSGRAAGDPNAAFSALFSAVPGRAELSSIVELVNDNLRLPGNIAARFRTRVDPRTVQVDGNNIVFTAFDVDSSFKGIFSISAQGAALKRVVSTGDSLPGLGVLDPAESFNGLAARNGQIAFRAGDKTGKSALFVAEGGTINGVVSTGERIGGQTIRFFEDINPTALDRGRLAFWASLEVTGPGQSDEVLALATSLGALTVVRAVVNAASNEQKAIAPGELVTLYGDGIGPAEALTASAPLPRELGGTRILFNDIAAPVYYVSATQVSASVPYGVEGKTSAQVTVERAGRRSAAFVVPATPASPGLFPAVLNEDGSVNSAANPAKPGSIIVLFGTGAGQTDPPGEEGTITAETLPKPALPTSVEAAGRTWETIYFGGLPGGLSGLFQVNARIPPDVEPGDHSVAVTVGPYRSQAGLAVAVR